MFLALPLILLLSSCSLEIHVELPRDTGGGDSPSQHEAPPSSPPSDQAGHGQGGGNQGQGGGNKGLPPGQGGANPGKGKNK